MSNFNCKLVVSRRFLCLSYSWDVLEGFKWTFLKENSQTLFQSQDNNLENNA